MAKTVRLEDALVAEAVKAGNHRSKREAVTAALLQYVKTKRRLGLLDLIGQIDYDPAYDYKAGRGRNNKRIGRPRG